jgi:COMPASS component SWD2
MKLTDEVVKSMAMGKVFKDNANKINAMDFYKDGELLVTSGDDESVHVYNTNTGEMQKVVYSKKYGVDLIRFTHNNNAVICASKNGWDESLRFLSLYDNRYLRYFKGHRDKVVSLAMSPIDDTFLSGSLDDTIRLWDLRTNACQGLLRRKGRPAVAYDPQGLIFAVSSSVNTIKLYDVRSFDKGPFSTFQVDYHPIEWTSMKFTNDGKHILLATNENIIFLIDAFDGQTVRKYQSFVNDNSSTIEASFSPDAQYVLSGSEDGTIHVWHKESGQEVAVWTGHAGPVGVVQWNPKSMMVASGCSSLVFWIPYLEGDAA